MSELISSSNWSTLGDSHAPVLVAGAGPVGLITALQLAKHGVKSILIERNFETTKWPKMDITNVRSMELLKRMGLDEDLRRVGVPGKYSFDVLFSTGLGDKGEMLTKWDLPSPDNWRTMISEKNDGSMPREPYQRCSQALFEAWLKPICEANPLIECHFGVKAEGIEEDENEVVMNVVDMTTGERQAVKTKYVVGCDGAGSRLRKSAGIALTGGPVPMAMLLVHFKSRDLTRLQAQGQFWHIYFTSGSVIISQDEADTWTVHTPVPLDCDVSKIDPVEQVYKALGGSGEPYAIKIDEILVKSSWRPNLAVANTYRSRGGRLFLAGDSAHQNIPTGGYGMNMGLGDAYDIGWKLAAVLNEWGGEQLLRSYEIERRPVALRNVDRSGVLMSVIWKIGEITKDVGHDEILTKTARAEETKAKIREHLELNDGENKDHGMEMDYRFPDSPVVLVNGTEKDRPWTRRHYLSSTRPGSRAPHVFLKDGKTSILDLYGPEYTLFDFTEQGDASARFHEVAEMLRIPLVRRHLPNESHVRRIWERDLVLVRPDGFVSWRCAEGTSLLLTDDEVVNVLDIATGKLHSNNASNDNFQQETIINGKPNGVSFSASGGNVDLDNTGDIALLGEFQK